ncbi:pyruvate dehydrogenase (acetyl-transferring) E1 component subunit alpha [Salsipaludibacter albus]|uniref:pyruvate dehydrogenase (acetyl-transferring) E1 component subunit alpha n=1 Tax=Salsipaludibacter albus TaxID=2849650 RepID=UPI001EE45A7B
MGASQPAGDVDPSTLLPPAEPVHLLDPDGTYHEDPDHPVDLDDDQLRMLYRHMVVTRKVDREAINLQRQGQLGVYASLLGQEAAQVGGAFALSEEDWVFPSYREMGAAVTRGVDTGKMLHLFRGTWLSDHDPYEHHFALYSIPIGTQALHAAGFAMGAKFDDNPIVTMAYFGDGATSEGDPHEAMTFAGVFKAPVVFFVQNNQWAISVPLDQQTAAPTLAHKAVGYGMPGHHCDGNDVLATYAVTRKAVDRARSGAGPALIEALTYRMEAHTTSDDPSRYRTRQEEEEAAKTDPIVRYKLFLEKEGLLDADLGEQVEAEAAAEATRMRDEIYEAPHGDPMELFEHVYVDDTGHFERQREVLATELAARDGEVSA